MKNDFLWGKILTFKQFFLSIEIYLMITFLFFIVWMLVFFRMKKVEFDYAYNGINKKIEKSYIVEKELKARKAELLSSKKLNELAKDYSLELPSEEQVIIVPQVY